jgi:hypothetical protein
MIDQQTPKFARQAKVCLSIGRRNEVVKDASGLSVAGDPPIGRIIV